MPKNNNSTKQKESALYRKLELFITILIKRTSNLPNIPMIQESCRRMTNELYECLTAVGYAYHVKDFTIRYNYLSEIEVHLVLIRTIIKVLFEYASSTNSRFMTPEQHAEYLIKLDEIEYQRCRWAESTLKYITKNSEKNEC